MLFEKGTNSIDLCQPAQSAQACMVRKCLLCEYSSWQTGTTLPTFTVDYQTELFLWIKKVCDRLLGIISYRDVLFLSQTTILLFQTQSFQTIILILMKRAEDSPKS